MLNTQTPRLLVADDDRSVLAAYRLVLDKLNDATAIENMFGLDSLEAELFGQQPRAKPNWRVTFVDQGLDAVNAVRYSREDADPYTAIFLDVRMPPGIDGYETAKRIRALDDQVHIIVVSGYSDYSVEDFLKVAGPAHLFSYIPKPLWPDQLRRVARVLALEANHRVQLNPMRISRAETSGDALDHPQARLQLPPSR
jgi:CheY-like chemotaxis protein